MSSEFRLDAWTGESVLIAPARAGRPGAFSADEPASAEAAERSPFLEGREDRSPPEVFALRDAGSPPNGPGWRVRVVPNKHPALVPSPPEPPAAPIGSTPPPASLPAPGRHEVVVECPHFETNLARLPVEAIRDVLFVFRERLRSHRAEGWACARVFKNKGRDAGATVAHSHSQIVALAVVPPALAREVEFARAFFDAHGFSSAEAALRAEREDGRRLLARLGNALAFCPFASRVPYECRIVATEPGASFDAVDDATLDEVAALLRGVLRGIERVVGEFPYNLVLRTLPFTEPPDSVWYRWSLDVLPRLGSIAGFELGGGTMINPVLPERAAAEIRSVQ